MLNLPNEFLFQVAMTRDKFPEKIPFRLTRMLINAMEVTGIEGSYRTTCESVMRVLRHNKDSLMAVLEAFVYDPLLKWRLIETGTKNKKLKTAAQVATGAETAGAAAIAGTADTATTIASAAVGLDSLGDEPEEKNPGGPQQVGFGGGAVDALLTVNQPALPAIAEHPTEEMNKKALDIIHRVRDKLTGRDFSRDETLDVAEQVDRLIEQATDNLNLCQSYIGWCPFW